MRILRSPLPLLALASLLAPAIQAQEASVFVVHGIPGQDLGLPAELPVDVAVNGACAIPGFEFGQIVGPLPFAPGSYTIEISPADEQNPCSQAPIITAVVDFAAGEDATVIAHLTESFGPTASKFVNDLSPTGFLQSRLIVQHTAAAPAVDIGLRRLFFGGSTVIENAQNGDQAVAEIFFGLYALSIAAAGTTDPVFGPVFGLVFPSRAYLVYAVGSLTNETFQLLVKPVRTNH